MGMIKDYRSFGVTTLLVFGGTSVGVLEEVAGFFLLAAGCNFSFSSFLLSSADFLAKKSLYIACMRSRELECYYRG